MKLKNNNKILFFVSGLYGGGAERVLVTLANAFCEQGKQVSIATYNDSDSAYPLNSSIRRINVFDGSEPVVNMSRIKRILWRLWKFRRIRHIVSEEIPDVVISFVTLTNNDVLFALLGKRVPVIVCEHTNVLRSYSSKTTFYRKLTYPFATAITVLTRHDYALWRKKYPQVVYMPNPTSVMMGTPIKPMSERGKTVLAVGTVISWKIKGFDNLLCAWGRLCHKYPDWKLCIAGKGDDNSFKYLNEIISGKKCINVEFLGFRNDIHDLMQQASIFCLSSRVEGLPMVLIEAMGLGCCCVAFDCTTGPREIIKSNSGLLVKDQDVDELTLKLELAMTDSTLREQYSAEAPQSVMDYSIERIIGRWNLLIDKVNNDNNDN